MKKSKKSQSNGCSLLSEKSWLAQAAIQSDEPQHAFSQAVCRFMPQYAYSLSVLELSGRRPQMCFCVERKV